MGELLSLSPSSLMLLHKSRRRGEFSISSGMASLSMNLLNCKISASRIKFPASYVERTHTSWKVGTSVVSDSETPATFTADSPGKGVEILADSGGSDDVFNGPNNGGDGGGGGDGNGGDSESGGDDESNDKSMKRGISMSQKLTLGYAALVGIGGLTGFLKGGSKKSLIAGGVSAALLLAIYTLLPSNPVLASSLGFGVSAALLAVMGSRFKKSGKIFPAGVVSGVSLVMTGGYIHGILRSLH